ncbi:hypothetical protein DU500_12490 [Haloplanus rubicundus]|uniref:Uncharacterized protein n=1 Tax=Haloplanus rubicundus TaxID=1547898 RepID=A0A345E4Q4_9EURY|nr:hypothetical protein DU500_12490 [Haloplanus rubicundus]
MPTATVRGHEIHYRKDGDEGPPIVMVLRVSRDISEMTLRDYKNLSRNETHQLNSYSFES